MKVLIALLCVFAVATADTHKYTTLFQSLSKLAQDQDEIEQVHDIIVEVRKEIQDDLNKLQNLYDSDAAAYADQTSTLQSTIDQLNQDISVAQTDLDNANSHAATIQEDINRALGDIAEAESGKDAEEARRVDAHNQFSATQSGLQEAIQAAKDALDLLEEAANQDLDAALIELNNKKMSKHASSIQASLAKLRVNSEVVPMVEVLVELAAQGVNSDIIGQLQDLIEHLVETLEAQLHAAVEQDNADDAYSRNAVQTFQDTIDTETAAVNAAQDDLNDTEDAIAELNDTLKEYNDILTQATESLADANSEWATKSSNYDALIHRLKKDIAALNEAEDFLDQ